MSMVVFHRYWIDCYYSRFNSLDLYLFFLINKKNKESESLLNVHCFILKKGLFHVKDVFMERFTMGDTGLILVLGSPNTDDGRLYSIAIERCELAFKEYKRKKNYKILLTGGYGNHFNRSSNPHASYLKKYLKLKGIPEKDFIEFAESTNTLEDASLSKPIVLKYGVKNILIEGSGSFSKVF